MATAEERREALKAVWEQASSCTKCPQLAATRHSVVFGAGNADADLMFVGEAPGANEDQQGRPFVGQAGKLLDQLLEEIGLDRSDAFVVNVLKCLGYHSQVQLADGSWERIGRLVRSRYDGEVMSVDEEGRLVARRVVGWHATPVAGRSVHRLTYRSAKAAGRHKVAVELTGDHPVLTERGFVPAADLVDGDRVATGQGLSDVAWDVACGTLLGDGSIGSGSSCLTFGHSLRQMEYAVFKAELVGDLGRHLEVREVAAGGDRLHPTIHVRTLAQRALRTLGSDFYAERKRVPAWMAGALNPRMLAIWFLDGGHLRVRPPRQPTAEIATNAFSGSDLTVLRRGLLRLGLPARASGGRLHFDVEATRRLSGLIAPFVPPSMRHKLHPAVEPAVPYDRSRFEPGPLRVLFDEVEVEEITDRPRADTTFFCIDVEGTHNFVTAGGVVHNCRPPQNRDPLPQEIDNCQDYLFRQIELIQPRVICTLGNFSTKLLRGDPTGITRLHGKEEVRVIGPRAVRLYPIYHPAAALYTRRLLDSLREDFARLPALLALDPPPQPERAAEEEPAVPEPELAADGATDAPERTGEAPAPPDGEAARPSPDARVAADSDPARPSPDPEADAPGADQLGLF